jgi:hypothetical protein
MGRSGMSALLIAGAVLILAGIVAFAIPVFTTQHTENVAKIGPLNVEATKQDTYVIPPVVSGGALVLGVVLMGAGFYQRR